MVVGIQLVGIVFSVVMMYFTYYYYRRNSFRRRDVALWGSVWLMLLLGVVFPRRLDLLLETFGVIGALQLFTITSILFLVALVFNLYITVQRNRSEVERLVRDLALRKLK